MHKVDEKFYLDLDRLEKIGRNVKTFRKERKLTLDELADKAEIAKSTIWAIEEGRTNTTILKMVAVAEALKVPISYLIYGDNSNLDKVYITKEAFKYFKKLEYYLSAIQVELV